MKNFIKGRWFPLLVAILIVAVVAFVMALFGWRITYIPELKNNWDAISAVAAWVGVVISAVSVIASFVAIWYAIQVPKKIANRQDKIALFEKRYECFQFFEECFLLYKKSINGEQTEEVINHCCHMLGVEGLEDLSKRDFRSKVKRFEYILHQMEFLFPGIQEDDISELYRALSLYLAAIIDQEDISKYKQTYIGTMIKFGKYTNEIWDSVTISNI